MRLPNSAHTSQRWRIHDVTTDFRLEDVWGIPAPGGPEQFARGVQLMTSFDPARSSSFLVRGLFAIRRKVGELLGWDSPVHGIGARVATLLDRLPPDLRDAPRPRFDVVPFESLYLLDDEWAAEIANQTMHGVMHLGLVSDGAGGYRAQMAVLVKPNGTCGRAYMAAIRPFRHLLVYPPLTREIEHSLRADFPPTARVTGSSSADRC